MMVLPRTMLSLVIIAVFASSVESFSPIATYGINVHHPAAATTSRRRRRQQPHSTALSMALTLYGSPGSRSPLVNWAAYELNVPLEAGDLSKNPHPFGQIPCLADDGDVVVFESGAILNYLQSKANNDKVLHGDARAAAVTSWIAWANASLDPICFLENNGRVYDTGLRSPNKRIDKLNNLLSTSSYLVPDGGFSLADVAVASYLLYVVQFFPDIELYSKWPHVVRYMKECAGRGNYEKAFGSNVQKFLLSRLEEMETAGDDNKKGKKVFGMF